MDFGGSGSGVSGLGASFWGLRCRVWGEGFLPLIGFGHYAALEVVAIFSCS